MNWRLHKQLETMETNQTAITRLQRKIDAVLRPLIPDGPLALIDFPDHPNVGDSAIWLGEHAFLSGLGKTPAYVSSVYNTDWAALKSAVGPDGTILIHGG